VLTIAVARGIRYTFWGFMGAMYGDRGLELLRAFDRWFLDRAEWFVAGAAVLVIALAVWAFRRKRAGPGVGEAP
jgi:hypothetical protein